MSHNNILCDEQHSFHHARSPAFVNHQWFATNYGQTDVILLDFSKAFDKVSHQHLFHKLYHYSVRGNLLEWLKDFLTDRSQRVLVNGEQSDSGNVTYGTPQGTVLAPLLFLCFINDLPHNITSTVRLYANDIILYRFIHLAEDCCNLQQDLLTLEKWAKKWNMSYNIQKCEFLWITTNLTLFFLNIC